MTDQKDTQPLQPDGEESDLKALSRRDFLRLSGLAAASVPFWEAIKALAESQRLQTIKDVEDKFGIDIVNPEEKDGLPENVKHLLNIGSLEIWGWTEPELTVLSQILKKLPPSMYSPEPTYAGRLQFLLSHHPYTDRGWLVGGSCDCKASYGVVILEKTPGSTPSQASFIESQSRVTHELAHKVLAVKRELIDNLFAALGISSSDLYGLFSNSEGSKAKARALKMALPSDLQYGTTEPPEVGLYEEFPIIAAEIYVRGGANFFRWIYSPFLGQQKSQVFYDWLRVNVFDGKTYNAPTLYSRIHSR